LSSGSPGRFQGSGASGVDNQTRKPRAKIRGKGGKSCLKSSVRKNYIGLGPTTHAEAGDRGVSVSGGGEINFLGLGYRYYGN